MDIEFDPNKRARNDQERDLPFTAVVAFDWETAMIQEDARHEYPERRFVAVGRIGQRLHVLCFTPISGGIRVISLRKANPREVKRYETVNR
jgi:uncharacterized DUF497 family protein